MYNHHRTVRIALSFITPAVLAIGLLASGCGPTYRELRWHGQRAMLDGAHGSAAVFFQQAEEKRPGKVDNLHDLGVCSVMLARDRFQEKNHAAAMREVDAAIAYYTAAIETHPGHQASLEGKNIALELKGQFGEALKHAEWAAEFVGPSAKQYIFLASELEERGDRDGAWLRYRQAVAVEPANPAAHRAFAKFLLVNNNEKDAVWHLQAAYRLDPTNKWVLEELASRGAVPPLATREPHVP
ncbi:MAG: hypothetical protein JSU63_00440 [Phycisphaerales bacterium]|nr:MAG: hypothetical protein JSU63_00440 [Phycisphaerales bacterium]